jgi:REP element-mobilizing transposase RayT
LSQNTQTTLYAWSLMSNHAHMLVRSGPQGLAHRLTEELGLSFAEFENQLALLEGAMSWHPIARNTA